MPTAKGVLKTLDTFPWYEWQEEFKQVDEVTGEENVHFSEYSVSADRAAL